MRSEPGMQGGREGEVDEGQDEHGSTQEGGAASVWTRGSTGGGSVARKRGRAGRDDRAEWRGVYVADVEGATWGRRGERANKNRVAHGVAERACRWEEGTSAAMWSWRACTKLVPTGPATHVPRHSASSTPEAVLQARLEDRKMLGNGGPD
jgi:hypothetical protein